MKSLLLLVGFAFLNFSNLLAQCPGATAENYKTKLQNAGTNMEATTAYSHLANYYNYKCKCDNGVTNPEELAKFIKNYAKSYSSIVSKYGTMSPINSCKGLANNSSNENSSSSNNEMESDNYLKGILNEAGIDESVMEKIINGDFESASNDMQYNKAVNDVQNMTGLNSSDSELVLEGGLAILGSLFDKINENQELREAEKEKLKGIFKEYVKRIDRIKDFQNTDGSYTSEVPFNYNADFTDLNWKKIENEFIESKIIDKTTLEVSFVKEVNNKDFNNYNQFFYSFENESFNIGKDYEISFEFGFDVKTKKFNLFYDPFAILLSNNNVFTIGGTRASFDTRLMPYSDYKISLNYSVANYIYPKEVAIQLPNDKPDFEFNDSEKKIKLTYLKEESKERKLAEKKIKKIKENEYWFYNKVKIIKKGEKITLHIETLNSTLDKTQKSTLYNRYNFIDENKVFLGLNTFYYKLKGNKFRIKNFTITQ